MVRKKQSETRTVAAEDVQRDVRLVPGNVGSSPAVSGHNSDITDDALIAENFKIEDLIKAAQAKFNEWALPHKTRLAEIETEISRRLLERNAKNTKTDSGTAYFSDLLNSKVDSVEALYDYVADHWENIGGEVKINLPVDVVRKHMEENDGKPPPGMSISFYKRLNVKRS